jgi:sporulation protein YlmC with PRC-barrel domain
MSPKWLAPVLISLVLLSTLAASTRAQPAYPPAGQMSQALVGLPIVTADGQRIGKVTEVGINNSEAVLIGEIERPLGIGADAVAIPTDMFASKGDHIELTITAVEVRDRLARPEQ